jgi:hypothetical protein
MMMMIIFGNTVIDDGYTYIWDVPCNSLMLEVAFNSCLIWNTLVVYETKIYNGSKLT